MKIWCLLYAVGAIAFLLLVWPIRGGWSWWRLVLVAIVWPVVPIAIIADMTEEFRDRS